jgi:hypothetical protein
MSVPVKIGDRDCPYHSSSREQNSSGRASKEASYAVNPGEDYVRYWPFAPSDAIQATCATSSDTLDMEYQ